MTIVRLPLTEINAARRKRGYPPLTERPVRESVLTRLLGRSRPQRALLHDARLIEALPHRLFCRFGYGSEPCPLATPCDSAEGHRVCDPRSDLTREAGA